MSNEQLDQWQAVTDAASEHPVPAISDKAFIATARDAMPQLIARVRELEAEVRLADDQAERALDLAQRYETALRRLVDGVPTT